jgi:hypothetical protein
VVFITESCESQRRPGQFPPLSVAMGNLLRHRWSSGEAAEGRSLFSLEAAWVKCRRSHFVSEPIAGPSLVLADLPCRVAETTARALLPTCVTEILMVLSGLRKALRLTYAWTYAFFRDYASV